MSKMQEAKPFATTRPQEILEAPKATQVGKRNVDAGQVVKNQLDSSVLFKAPKMTNPSSTSKRPKLATTSTSTTKRPTTTRKWRTSTSRPKIQHEKNATTVKSTNIPATGMSKLAKLLKPTPELSTSMPTTSPAPSTTTSSTTTTTTTTTTTSTTTSFPSQTTITRMTTAKRLEKNRPSTANVNILARMMAVKSRTNKKMDSFDTLNFVNAKSLPIFAKPSQLAPVKPLNQRRAPQTVNFPRGYTNRPSERSAGENWVLFNRPDGGFSVFEIMVLMSNIMIVSTIVLVVLMSWIRSFKKKRAPSVHEPVQNQGRNMTNPADANLAPTGHQADGSDRGSKMSMVSSGISNLTSATMSEVTTSQQQSSGSHNQPQQNGSSTMRSNIQGASNMIRPKLDEANVVAATAAQQLVGAAQNVSSEFKSGSMNLANKAMAIVQPTENNTQNQSTSSDSDKVKIANSIKDELLGHNQRTISRSVSDLSGDAKIKKESSNSPTQQQTRDLETADKNQKTTTLEELFGGSGSQNQGKGSGIVTDKPSGSEKPLSGDGKKTVPTSASSLESIDLPGELVESIRKSVPKSSEPVEAPSPNLLLGETERQVEKSGGSKGAKDDAKQASKDIKSDSDPAGKDLSSKQNPTTSEQRKPPAKEETKPASSKPKVTDNTKNPAPKNLIEVERPQNPMGRDEDTAKQQVVKKQPEKSASVKRQATGSAPDKSDSQQQAQVKNHQVVVNKLDKRKTNLEIVDLRDESVTGKMRADTKSGKNAAGTKEALGGVDEASGWISMDGLAVVQSVNSGVVAPNPNQSSQSTSNQSPASQSNQILSPSEIIESRFRVDYGGKKKSHTQTMKDSDKKPGGALQQDSLDSKAEESMMNNIENELELDNKMRNRKYFVYIVHDGHFTAKKECIARIELPPKRRITLAELRQLIANSQDISLSSLRRNRFKFVTETYRLLNENEDAAVLHQVYPTQGVFLKLNIPEQENQVYPFKGSSRGTRLPSGSGPTPSSLSQTTISSRRRAAVGRAGKPKSGDSNMPAIEVDEDLDNEQTPAYGRSRASSVGRRGPAGGGATRPPAGGAYRRSKSNVQAAGNRRVANQRGSGAFGSTDRMPSMGRSKVQHQPQRAEGAAGSRGTKKFLGDGDNISLSPSMSSARQAISSAATDLGANVLSGAKRLLNATFHL